MTALGGARRGEAGEPGYEGLRLLQTSGGFGAALADYLQSLLSQTPHDCLSSHL